MSKPEQVNPYLAPFEDMPFEDYEEMKIIYTEGECHGLAMTLNRITGWPVVIISDVDVEDYRTKKIATCHAVVRHPTGNWLDVTGLKDPFLILDDWEWLDMCHYWDATISDLDQWSDPHLDLAESAAAWVLKTFCEKSLTNA